MQPQTAIVNSFQSTIDMSTALSKRHQARNERALQELIRTVPGNDRCADCQSKNPGRCLSCSPSSMKWLTTVDRMGKLECKLSTRAKTGNEDGQADQTLSWASFCACDAPRYTESSVPTSPKSSP